MARIKKTERCRHIDETIDRPSPQAWTFGRKVLLLLGIAVSWQAADLILVGFASLLLAIFIRSLSEPTRALTGGRDRLALILTCTLLAGIVVIVGIHFSSDFSEQAAELRKRLPEALGKLKGTISQNPIGLYLLERDTNLEALIKRTSLLSRATGVLSATAGIISSVIVVTFLTLFLALNPSLYREGFIRLVHPNRREEIGNLIGKLGATLRWWLVGKAVSMLIVGLVTGLGLNILGVRLALVLGVLAGALSFIPYVGPIVSGVPAVLLGLLESPGQAFNVVILYSAIQLVESNVLSPFIDRKTVYLPPALTILCQVLAAILFGFLGVLLASPLTAVGLVVVRELYVKKLEENGSRDRTSSAHCRTGT